MNLTFHFFIPTLLLTNVQIHAHSNNKTRIKMWPPPLTKTRTKSEKLTFFSQILKSKLGP